MRRAILLPAVLLLAGCSPWRDVCPHAGDLCTFAGTGLAALGPEEVDASTSPLYLPQDMTAAPDGSVIVLDWNNHRIRQVDADHVVRTVAGSGILGDGPEGDCLAAQFNHPTSAAFAPDGALIVAAWHNSRVERVDLATRELTYIAGNGQRSYGGDGGPAVDAVLDLPSGVAFDAAGNLYVSDQANQLIRRIDPQGMIDRIAGIQREPGYTGDGGPALDAHLYAAVGQQAAPSSRLAVFGDSLYLADTGNHAVRHIDLATGIITTVVGDGTPGLIGDGGPAEEARLSGPTDVATGPDGSLYIADTGNSCVRRVDPEGIIETVAGICGEVGLGVEGEAATATVLNQPYGVEVDERGDLFIADTYNHLIRLVRQ